MGQIIRTLTLAATLVVASAVSIGAAIAQSADYPTKPIKFIIPYAPGGGTDAVAAVFSDKLAQKLGQPIIIRAAIPSSARHCWRIPRPTARRCWS